MGASNNLPLLSWQAELIKCLGKCWWTTSNVRYGEKSTSESNFMACFLRYLFASTSEEAEKPVSLCVLVDLGSGLVVVSFLDFLAGGASCFPSSESESESESLEEEEEEEEVLLLDDLARFLGPCFATISSNVGDTLDSRVSLLSFCMFFAVLFKPESSKKAWTVEDKELMVGIIDVLLYLL